MLKNIKDSKGFVENVGITWSTVCKSIEELFN